VVRLVSWNVARRDLWADLNGLGADLALLQEVRAPLAGQALEVYPDVSGDWTTAATVPLRFRTAVARLSVRVGVVPRPTFGHDVATAAGSWIVSRQGTVAAADVTRDGHVLFTAVSAYAPWEMAASRGYADASAHRILSDLSALMGRRHRLVVAGDWNILRGYGEYGDAWFAKRYATVFERAEALGLRIMGPEYPSGRQADPWPEELPLDSLCVPTFHHAQQTPATGDASARLRVRISFSGRSPDCSGAQRGGRVGA